MKIRIDTAEPEISPFVFHTLPTMQLSNFLPKTCKQTLMCKMSSYPLSYLRSDSFCGQWLRAQTESDQTFCNASLVSWDCKKTRLRWTIHSGLIAERPETLSTFHLHCSCSVAEHNTQQILLRDFMFGFWAIWNLLNCFLYSDATAIKCHRIIYTFGSN